jgi:branched-chain amino acid transport system permease protein
MLSVKGVSLTRILPIVLILVISMLVPPFVGEYYVLVLIDVVRWLALAVAWDFFSGYTKYISLGAAAFFGMGMYVTAWVLEAFPALPFPVVVLFAALVDFALALVIGLVTLRLRGIYFAILTFSVAMVITNIITYVESEVIIPHTRGTYPPAFPTLVAYYTMLISVVVVFLLTALFRRSKFGLALKMIGENEEAAVHVGVNASIYKTVGFAISAMLTGVVGACYVTASFGYINTDSAFDPALSFYPPVMALLGGMGTVYGPVVGAIFLSLLKNYLSVTISYFLIVFGLVLIVVVMFMPNGIMGVIEKIRTKGFSGSIRELVGKIRTTRLFAGRKKARKKPVKAAEKPAKDLEKPP